MTTNLAEQGAGRKRDRRGSPKPYRMHDSLTVERICEAVEQHNESLDNPGFCIACGADVEGVEPDARRDKCEACGER